MLTLLTQYLLKYKKLTLPHVGTFEVEDHSPSFNVVDQIMQPPAYSVRWRDEESTSLHQLRFLQTNTDYSFNVREELENTGRRMASLLQSGPYDWNGIGVLQKSGNAIHIERNEFAIDGFSAVPAHKVIREGAVHQILVGDRETDSQQIADVLTPQKRKLSIALIIGWVLLALALVAIIYFLYQGNWRPQSTGLKLKHISSSLLPVY